MKLSNFAFLISLAFAEISGECFKDGINYPGNNIKSTTATNKENCRSQCVAEVGCNAWTFKKTGSCELKSTFAEVKKDSNFVSGPKDCEGLDTLKERYCKLDLDKKRELLESDELSAEQVESLLASVRVCSSGGPLSCGHSTATVLNYTSQGKTKLDGKFEKGCNKMCKNLKKATSKKLDKFQRNGLKVLAKAEAKSSKTVIALDKLSGKFASLLSTAESVQEELDEVNAEVDKSELDDSTKKGLKDSAKEAAGEAKDNPKKFKNAVEEMLGIQQAFQKVESTKATSRKAAFMAGITKVKDSIKKYATVENIAKASKAASAGASALSKFLTAENNGTIDAVKVVSGALDVVDAIAAYLPPPASIFSGAIVSIFGMFSGGGGPTTESVIKEEFKKQKKFIEDQFKRQEEFLEKLMGKTQLESIQARAFGVLDASDSRYEFIAGYEGLATCLHEDVINQITLRVEFFMDESDAASVKHAFDIHCPKVLNLGEALESQTVCGLLLYTYLTIETKRHEILTIMLSLLEKSERFEELTIGYLRVQKHQKESLTAWVQNTFRVEETYCGMFVYHRAMWVGKEKQLAEVLNTIDKFVPKLNDEQTKKCDADCSLNNYNFEGGNIDSKSFPTRDAMGCFRACRHEAECNYWTFDSKAETCSLKRKLGKVVKSGTYENHTSGPKFCFSKKDADKELPKTSCMETGVEMTNPKNPKVSAGNQYLCQLRCQKSSSCNYFVYDKSNQNCYLSAYYWDAVYGKGDNIVSGNSWCPASLDTCYEHNTDFNGNDIKTLQKIESVADCQSECSKLANCFVFTYESSTKKCFLKWKLGDVKYDKPNLISGYQGCACGQYGAKIKNSPVEVVQKVPNIEICYKICKTQKATCKAWVYNTDGKSCALFNIDVRQMWYDSISYDGHTNPVISGPNECTFRRGHGDHRKFTLTL